MLPSLSPGAVDAVSCVADGHPLTTQTRRMMTSNVTSLTSLFPPMFDDATTIEDYEAIIAKMELEFKNQTYPGPLPTLRPAWEMTIKVILYAIIIFVSLIGNSLIVFVVWRSKRMHSPTNYFIVNLAVSDIMITVICTWVHLVIDFTNNQWILGRFFCKLNGFAQVMSLVSNILTLALIACDRFVGIVFAMKAYVMSRRSWLFIVVVWIIAVAVASPLCIYRELSIREWANYVEKYCQDTWPVERVRDPIMGRFVASQRWRTIYYTFVSMMLFFVPILIMSAAYSVVIYKLWSSQMPGERVDSEMRSHDKIKKKVIIMLVVMLSVFTFCWLPFQIGVLYPEYRTDKNSELPAWHSKFYFLAQFMAFTNCALNPIIYTGFNENFRRGFNDVLRCGKTGSRTTSLRTQVTTSRPKSIMYKYDGHSSSSRNSTTTTTINKIFDPSGFEVETTTPHSDDLRIHSFLSPSPSAFRQKK